MTESGGGWTTLYLSNSATTNMINGVGSSGAGLFNTDLIPHLNSFSEALLIIHQSGHIVSYPIPFNGNSSGFNYQNTNVSATTNTGHNANLPVNVVLNTNSASNIPLGIYCTPASQWQDSHFSTIGVDGTNIQFGVRTNFDCLDQATLDSMASSYGGYYITPHSMTPIYRPVDDNACGAGRTCNSGTGRFMLR